MVLLQARLKPHDPAKGNLRMGLNITSLGLTFDHGVIVSGITEKEAAVLREIRQRDNDPKSALAFDILTEPEMKKLLAREGKERLGLTPDIIAAVREGLTDDEGLTLRAKVAVASQAPVRNASDMRRAAGRDPAGEPPAKSPKRSRSATA